MTRSSVKVGSTGSAALRAIKRRPARAGDLTGELTNMTALGTVTSGSARIWLRSERLSPLELAIWPLADPENRRRLPVPERATEETDHTASVAYPDDFPGEPALSPTTRYGFRVVYRDDGTSVGEGTFETAPGSASETPELFTFAFMSCHQPYDSDGSIDRRALRMLNLIEPTLGRSAAKYVLLVGDQMYADYPRKTSLFRSSYFQTIHHGSEQDILDCSEEEIRRHYQKRYRIHWNLPKFTSFQNHYPSYCMLDDHEIVDNWGSGPEHSEPRWQKLGRAARAAYFDYQGSRTLPRGEELPDSFHYSFRYGASATFVADMRSQRRAGNASNRIFGDDQFEALKSFLSSTGDCGVVFLVLTVPTLYVPDWMANLGVRLLGEGNDISDRWGWRKNTPDRTRLLRMLREHKESHRRQKVVILSGDIHLGLALRMQWDADRDTSVYQFVSSAVTNSLDPLEYVAAKIAAHAMPNLHQDGHELQLELLQPASSRLKNPFSGLNLGLVDVRSRGEEPRVRFRLITHGRSEYDEPVVAFDSGEL